MMNAMVLEGLSSFESNPAPLRLCKLPVPAPGPRDLLLKVHACGVCHTELDEIEGRTPPSFFPIIPGHQVVGEVVECGSEVDTFSKGERAGVAWIYSSCGVCDYCLRGFENLCRQFKATGRDANGGYAEYMTVPALYAYTIPEVFSDAEAAPLLCAGAIGYRSLRLTGLRNGQILALYGFGASGHLVFKLARFLYPDSPVFVHARSEREQEFALSLGADWAGDTLESPPDQPHAVIEMTPAWEPVLAALETIRPGGRVVINVIRKEPGDSYRLSSLSYERHLWMEKEIKSVANITRGDVREFLGIAANMALKAEVQLYQLENANQALLDIRERRIRGAKVLQIL